MDTQDNRRLVDSERIRLQIPVVVGTRPEAIKLVPVIQTLCRSPLYEPIVVSTGQHDRMVNEVFELAGIKTDVTLWAGARHAQLNQRVASVMERFEDFIAARFGLNPGEQPSREQILTGGAPAAVIVHGDTSSAMAAALSAFHMRLPVVHVEAGLGIADGVTRLARRFPEVSFVLPVHPNPQVREVLLPRVSDYENILTIDPLGYGCFAQLLGRSDLVITDSGGIQEEAPSLDKPVLVLRDTTERTEGLVAGTVRLVGTDPNVIEREAARLLEDEKAYAAMADARNPYGDGHAAARIVQAMEHILLGREAPTQFGPGYDRDAVLRLVDPLGQAVGRYKPELPFQIPLTGEVQEVPSMDRPLAGVFLEEERVGQDVA